MSIPGKTGLLFFLVWMQFVCSTVASAQRRFSSGDSLRVVLTADSLNDVLSRVWWQYSPTDTPGMAMPAFNDSSWKYIHSEDIDSSILQGVGWFRLHFWADTSLVHKHIMIRKMFRS
jgi:hypothetical protein